MYLGDVSRGRCPRQISARSRRALEHFSHVFIPRIELVLMRGEMARDEAQRGIAVPKLRNEPALPACAMISSYSASGSASVCVWGGGRTLFPMTVANPVAAYEVWIARMSPASIAARLRDTARLWR